LFTPPGSWRLHSSGVADGLPQLLNGRCGGPGEFANGIRCYRTPGYKGDATFGHAADGTPTVSGAKHLTVLAQGDLITGTGHLAFGADGGITGEVNTSMQIDG